MIQLSNNYFSEQRPKKQMKQKFLVRKSLINEESIDISSSNNQQKNIFHNKYPQEEEFDVNLPSHKVCGGLMTFHKVKAEIDETRNLADQEIKSVELNSFQKFKMQFHDLRGSSQSQQGHPAMDDMKIFEKQQAFPPQVLVTQDLEEEIRKTVSRLSDQRSQNLNHREYLSKNERALKNYEKYSNRWKVQLDKSASITKRSKDESIYRLADGYRQKEEKKLLLDYIQHKIERYGNQYWRHELRSSYNSRDDSEEFKQLEVIRNPCKPPSRPLTGFEDNQYYNKKIEERILKVQNILPSKQNDISGLYIGGQSKLQEEIKCVRKLVKSNLETEPNKKKGYTKIDNKSQSVNETIASKWDKQTKFQSRFNKLFL